MIRLSRALPIAVLLVLAACTPAADATPTATPEPTASATPESSPSPEETESPEPTASSSPIQGVGGFTWEANDEADALMDETFTCENLDDGYQVDFPAEWNANAEVGREPPCSWFAPTEYETGAPGDVPDEVAIVIRVIDGEREYGSAEVLEREEGIVGATQSAYRALVEFDDETVYEYVVQLGPTWEEGPNLVVGTADTRGDDFELNRAVLDRMMATMEFIGTIQ
jgi:hypothetical protein